MPHERRWRVLDGIEVEMSDRTFSATEVLAHANTDKVRRSEDWRSTVYSSGIRTGREHDGAIPGTMDSCYLLVKYRLEVDMR